MNEAAASDKTFLFGISEDDSVDDGQELARSGFWVGRRFDIGGPGGRDDPVTRARMGGT